MHEIPPSTLKNKVDVICAFFEGGTKLKIVYCNVPKNFLLCISDYFSYFSSFFRHTESLANSFDSTLSTPPNSGQDANDGSFSFAKVSPHSNKFWF